MKCWLSLLFLLPLFAVAAEIPAPFGGKFCHYPSTFNFEGNELPFPQRRAKKFKAPLPPKAEKLLMTKKYKLSGDLASETYYCPIACNHAMMTTTASGITFAWILNQAAMPTGSTGLWANCRSDGGDIRFTSDSAGTIPLHSEILNFVQATPAGLFYVGLPAINSSTDPVVYVWYGGASLTTPAASDATWGSQGVWDANYVGVYHCQEASGDALDSTGNGNTFVASGTPGTTTGEFGAARSFNGSTDYFTANAHPDLAIHSLELWFVPGSSGYISLIGDLSANTYSQCSDNFQIYDEWDQICYLGNPSVYVYCYYLGAHVGKYHYGLTVPNNGFSTLSDYFIINGVLHGRSGLIGGGVAPNVALCGPLQLGANGQNGQLFTGWMQEVRISNIARSADWIKTGYNNQASVSTAGTAGTPVPITAPAAPKVQVIIISEAGK